MCRWGGGGGKYKKNGGRGNLGSDIFLLGRVGVKALKKKGWVYSLGVLIGVGCGRSKIYWGRGGISMAI